jgi:alpha-tubulin suppressor-like RCC1 family protein
MKFAVQFMLGALLMFGLLFCSNKTFAQGAVQVDVRLTQPPPNQLRIADLWRIELNNRSGQTLRVYLHGTAEELSIPDGLIADARSKVLVLGPGRTTVTGNDVQPVTIDEANERYREALLRTGSVPTGDYRICCEVILEESDVIVGRDCKFTTVNRVSQAILISPPDESEVAEQYPIFTWMNSSPPSPGSRTKYAIRIAEIFANQSAQDAIVRNPAWLSLRDLQRTMFQYPISARKFVSGQRYAWMINAYEERGTTIVPLAQSEVWMFTYVPFKPDMAGGDTTRGDGGAKGGRPTSGPGGFSAGRLTVCNGENWDFESGSVVCWTPYGDFVPDNGVEFVPNGAHVALGSVGHNGTYWFTTYGIFQGNAAMGSLVSEEFQVAHSHVEASIGGVASASTSLKILVQKLAKDTFSLPTMTLPQTGSTQWYVAHSTKAADASGAERLSTIRWDVLRFLNRTAHIVITDSSKDTHLSVDNIRFFDQEKLDVIKQPVYAMAVGETHSLAATKQQKPDKFILKDLAENYSATVQGKQKVTTDMVVQQQTGLAKSFANEAAKNFQEESLGNFTYNASVAKSTVKEGATVASFNTDQMAKVATSPLIKDSKSAITLWAWGDNFYRQAIKTNSNTIVEPTIVSGVSEVIALGAGMERSFASLKSGKVLAWGLNDYGQLGTGDRKTRTQPTELTCPNFITMAAGSRHSLGLTEKGEVYVWGYGRTFELGSFMPGYYNATTGQIDSIAIFRKPTKHVFLTGVVDIAAGHSHSIALQQGGRIFTWGVNSNGQTGHDMDIAAIGFPLPIDAGNKGQVKRRYVAVAAGFDHSMALASDGSVWTWGGNASGQLGDGTTKDRETIKQVQGVANVVAIAAGQGFSLALDSAGNVYAWGNNVLGQLGDGTRKGKRVPTKVQRLDGIHGIVAGGAHSMAVQANGGLWTWGTNEYGQLGQGPITNLTPVPLDPPLGPFLVERLATP